MAKRKMNSRRNNKPKSSRARKQRLASRAARKNAQSLNFEALEPKQLLAGVTVGNATDLVNAPDVSSIAALIANDGGDGISLREAITAANNDTNDPSDTITFDSSLSGQTILLGGSALNSEGAMIVDASSLANGITINANQQSRVWFHGSSSNQAPLTLQGLTLTGGSMEPNSGLLSVLPVRFVAAYRFEMPPPEPTAVLPVMTVSTKFNSLR